MTTDLKRLSARGLAALFVLLLVQLLGTAGTAVADGSTGSDEPDPTSGTPTVKFGMGPARAVPKDQMVDGRPYLVYLASPGATISDEVVLLNYGDSPLPLQVYATDAVQAADGGFGLLPGGQKPADAGSWIDLEVPQNGKVMVPPRTKKGPGQLGVPMRISIPANATPGDHVGGVLASLKVTSTNSQGAQVTLDQRIGIRAYFQLSGDLKPQLQIEDLKASYDDQNDPLGRGLITVSYVVHNTGNMRLDATQDVSVDRLLVSSVEGSPAPIEDILPGSRIQVTQTFKHKFGLGPMTAKVTLHPKAVDPGYALIVTDVTASKAFWAWPWVLIAIVGGLLILLLGLNIWRRHRKRRRRRLAAESGPVPARGRTLASHGVPLLVALLLGLGSVLIGAPSAEAKAPDGSLGEVMFETTDVTCAPSKALLDGWWGHEGGKKGDGSGTTYISMNAGDDAGAVTDKSLAALHDALKDGGSFDALRVAFVPYSADGSNERPQVTKGETVADAFDWFADAGVGTPFNGNTNPNDFVATVSTGAEYLKWWDAGRPLQGYTNDLKVLDIADDSSTAPAAAPQGRSILDRWPAGQKISMVLYLSDGTDKTRPGLPTVAVGSDGRAMTSWLTFKTVAAPGDATRSSAGYQVLTGAGTGADAPAPPGDPVQTGKPDPSGGSTGGASADGAPPASGNTSGGASPGASGADSAAPTPGAATPTPGADTEVGDKSSENAVVDAVPGGTPAFVLLLLVVVLGGAAWATWWLRSGRSRPGGRR